VPIAVEPKILDLERVVARTLPNGLRVRLYPDSLVPTVSYYTFFRVGSRNERPGLTGISHLFEHMMFNGSQRYGPKEFDRILEANGGTSNAYTSNDVTVYYDDFAAEALPTVIDLESDRVRSLRLDEETLEQERAVVKEERRLRTDNSTFGLMEEQLEGLVYQAHPYRWPVIGWMDDIDRIAREDCLSYFRTYYAPSNAALYVAGDIDPEVAMRQIEEAYGDIPQGPAVPPVPAGEPEQRGERRAEVRYPAQAAAVVVGFRGPPACHPDAAALDVLQACLAVGEGSRLRRRLVQQEVAVSASIGWAWRIDPGVFMLFLELAPGASRKRAEEALFRELDRVATRGVQKGEVERARRLLRSSVLHELATRSGVAHALGQAELLLGDWRHATKALEQYREVGPPDVRRVAEAYLAPRSRNVVWLEPESSP